MTNQVLTADCIKLGLKAKDKTDAIQQCGQVLLKAGVITEQYAAAMLDREKEVSTYLGEGFAIPHGTNEAREWINRAGLGFLQFPDGVDWDGETAYVCIPIASNSDEHVGILGALAEILMDPDASEKLRSTNDPQEVLNLLASIREDD